MKRLLKYKLNSFNYSNTNKGYKQQWYSRLLANYIFNEYNNEILALKSLIKYSKTRTIQMLITDLVDLKSKLQDTFNCEVNKQNSFRFLNLMINPNLCKHCNSEILNSKALFCSNLCSNRYKSNSEEVKQKISSSLITFNKNCDVKTKEMKNKKIKDSIIEYNSYLSDDDKKIKYSNKNLRFTAFEALNKFNFTLLFDKEFFYSNTFLPVKCNYCSFEWELTKSSTLCRTNCPKCTNKKAKTQNKLYLNIQSLINCKQNDKTLIKPYEIDILIEKSKLCIEFNGLLPHSFGFSKVSFYNQTNIDSDYHLNKTELVEEKGYQLFHIFESEFLDSNKKEIWESIIRNRLKLNNKLYARKCVIKEVQSKESNEFLEQNHLQGKCSASIRLGLYFQDELVSLMTFGKSRFNKNVQYELIRFCSKKNTSIIGAGSKLLKYFEKEYKPESLISYANRRWSQGNLYEQLGFKFIENTKPNFFFFKENQNILLSRQLFQKHNQSSILKSFDSNKTAMQNMFENGYRVIYDSGNKKYLKYYK